MRLTKEGLALLLLALAPAASAAPTILGTDPNLDGQTLPGAYVAVNTILGPGVITVDYQVGGGDVLQSAGDTSAQNCPYTGGGGGSCGTHVNHAPYFAVAWATETIAQTATADTSGNYQILEGANAIGVLAAPNSGTNGAVSGLPVSVMSVSSPNSADANKGTGGYGTDLFLSANYLGLVTNSDSADIGALTGIFTAVGVAHSTFNAFDVHAVLRQTASNWSTGWNTTNGFGNVNYSTASGTIATIFLEAPNLQITNHGYYATATLYPFRTTRRVKEVVYIGGTWPSPATGCSGSTCNEYTAAQIAAAGGTLVYTSNGTDVTPTFTYTPPSSMTVTFYALTLDASGNGSRVESFAGTPETFVVGTSCPR